MNLKINLKARLKRCYQNQIHISKKNTVNVVKKFKILALILVLLFPIYPSFWSFAYEQWPAPDYDPNTILSSYEDVQIDWEDWFSGESWFVKPWEVSLGERDLTWVNKIVIYKVKAWDSFDIIADKFEIDAKSIIWANNLSEDKVLQPWEEIRIPPVSGFVYNVESGDTLDSIVSKFGIDKNKIIEQNKLDVWIELKIWQVLIIPGWQKTIKTLEKEEETKIIKDNKDPKKDNKKDPKKQDKKPIIVKKDSNKKPVKSWYNVAWRWGWNKFAPGYCTRFVANYKNVTWRWNAWEWLHNAAAVWVPTWSSAAAWAIVVFRWRWYNSYYWHVWLVAWIEWDSLIIKDMNYAWRYVVTIRKIPLNDSSIRGYIYAN